MKNKISFLVSALILPSFADQSGCNDSAFIGMDLLIENETNSNKVTTASKGLPGSFALTQTQSLLPAPGIPPQVKAYTYDLNSLHIPSSNGGGFMINFGYHKRMSESAFVKFQLNVGFIYNQKDGTYNTLVSTKNSADTDNTFTTAKVRFSQDLNMGAMVFLGSNFSCFPKGEFGFGVGVNFRREKARINREHPIQSQATDQATAATIYQNVHSSKISPALHLRAYVSSLVGGANSKMRMGLFVGAKVGGKSNFTFKDFTYAPTTYQRGNPDTNPDIITTAIDSPAKISKKSVRYEAGLTLTYMFK